MVNIQALNVRTRPNVNANISKEVSKVYFGAIIRVVEAKDNWYKISQDRDCWISVKYTKNVKRAIVTALVLNVRNGASSESESINILKQEEEVFEYERKEIG